MKWWTIRKWPNGKWVLLERRLHGNQLEFDSYRWSDCIEYMNAIERNDHRKVYSMLMERATLCRGF